MLTVTEDNLQKRLGLSVLVCGHVALCCLSLFYVAHFTYPGSVDPHPFHIIYDPARLYVAVSVVIAFASVSSLFVFARFSFGYFCGFYLYTMALGYLWLNCFSDFRYDHVLGGLSAAASAIAFLLPALLITSPVRQTLVLSASAVEGLLRLILVFAVAIIVVGASYNFHLVSLENIYDFRAKLDAPPLVNYLVGITSNALLPFAFACFVMSKDYWRAGAALVLLLLFFPITLSKLSFFSPAWLIFFAILSTFFKARTAVVLSLLGPVLLGVVLNLLLRKLAVPYFYAINFRMIAIPSNALDVYSDYFSRHELTYFCQISLLKRIIACPYQEPLSIVMQKAYDLGNFNASLFATEGVASVGMLLAPIPVFLCGLFVALGNRLSAGLPSRFVLMSSPILPQVLLNVPLSTVLLTHGAGLLFLLWYIMPRALFEQKAAN
jgi:hypothetical protein